MKISGLLKDTSFQTSLIFGLICGAISYWFQPYNERKVLGIALFLLLGLLTFVASLPAVFVTRGVWFQIPLFLCAGVIISVMGRILYDVTFVDKTHHNLWPFEVLFVLGIILPASFVGVFMASLLKKAIK